jgi:predicted oxidoreductase
VVCTGGFVANHEMVLDRAAHLRTLPRVLSGGSPGALGAGHALLEGIGAQFVNLDHIWVYPNGTPDPQDPTGVRGLGVRGLVGDVWINTAGRRFHDETLRGGRSGTAALLAQPGHTAWSVFTAAETDGVLLIDNEYYGTPAGPKPAAMAQFWAGSAHVRRAGSPRDLAAAIGVPPGPVEAALAAIDDDLSAGRAVDSAFGRDLNGVRPFTGTALVALQFFPMAQKNFGGVRTDLDCRVLDGSGAAIAGLYAAGEVAGMAGGAINGRAGLEGTMFGPCLYSGRVAGAVAAKDVRVPA